MQTAILQKKLFSEEQKLPQLILNIDPAECVVSRFNPRKTRKPEEIKKIAEQMLAIGFKPDRALYAYRDNSKFEVFAGGNRLQAAIMAGVKVCIWDCSDWTIDQIARLADEDNNSDGLHNPVMPMDIWAEYARLRDDEGWSGKRIAEAKGVAASLVSERLSWHDLPQDIKSAVGADESSSTPLSEYHIRQVWGKVLALEPLSHWAQVDQWRIDLLRQCIKAPKSSRALAQDWQKRKDAVNRAGELIATIPDGNTDEYIFEDGIKRVPINWQNAFCTMLISSLATSTADVDRTFSALGQRQKKSEQRKQDLELSQDAAAQSQREQQHKIEEVLARWQHGNCIEWLPTLPDSSIRLVLTDPPYGMDFQSNRRTASPKAEKIQSDGNEEEARWLFQRMLLGLEGKLLPDAHLLIFTHWRTEFLFREALEEAGYTIKGSLIWVKENHTSGDLDGSFAPRHERIIHAVKGKPTVSPRIDDVLMFARNTNSDHPTEKPVDLLKQLINSTAAPGEVVIDPFGGVASTLVAASALGRVAYGCELDNNWWQQGYDRLIR